MANNYPLQSFEEFICELNPAVVQPYPLTDAKVRDMQVEILKIKQATQIALQEMFYETRDDKIIRKNHQSIVLLINKTYQTRRHADAFKMNVVVPLDEAMVVLEQLLNWYQDHYREALNDEQPYPITRLKDIRATIVEKLDSIRDILLAAGNEDYAISLVTNVLTDFVQRIDNFETITKHEAEYHQALVNDIEATQGHSPIVSSCPSLHELLVYWNVNSMESISYFTKGFEQILATHSTIQSQLDYLRLQQKYVQQLPVLSNFVYNPRYPSIKEYFIEYIENELQYLEKKNEGFKPSQEIQEEYAKPAKKDLKILTSLTVDQLSLVLRAFCDTGLIITKSLSGLCKAVAPFIATELTDNPSASSMRTKAYTGERRDIDAAKQKLLSVVNRLDEM